MSSAIRPRSAAVLVMRQDTTGAVPRVDDLVTSARRWVERKLPWYDPDRHAAAAAAQIKTVESARQDERVARRTLEAYRAAHGIRRE